MTWMRVRLAFQRLEQSKKHVLLTRRHALGLHDRPPRGSELGLALPYQEALQRLSEYGTFS